MSLVPLVDGESQWSKLSLCLFGANTSLMGSASDLLRKKRFGWGWDGKGQLTAACFLIIHLQGTGKHAQRCA